MTPIRWLSATLGVMVVTLVWWAWLFRVPPPPDALLSGYPTILVVVVGLVSSALVDGGPRVYAATIPVTAAFIGIGAISLARWAGRAESRPAPRPGSDIPPVAAALILILLSGPAVWLDAGRLESAAPEPEAPLCEGDAVPAVVDPRPGSSVIVAVDGGDARPRHPFVTRDAFRREFAARFSLDLEPPLLVTRAFDRLNERLAWYVVEEFEADAPPGRVALCGRWRNPAVFVGEVARGR